MISVILPEVYCLGVYAIGPKSTGWKHSFWVRQMQVQFLSP